MTDPVNKFGAVPQGWHTITPRIVVLGAERFVAFLADVFGAKGSFQEARPSIMEIGNSIVMVSEAGSRAAMPTFLYMYVVDVDTVYQRALKAGVRTIEPPFDTPYGDRRCTIEDKWGNIWQVATYGDGGDAT